MLLVSWIQKKLCMVIKSKIHPFDESTNVPKEIEDAFQEDWYSAATSFSLFINFAQYGRIPIVQPTQEEEEKEGEGDDEDEENDDDDEKEEEDNDEEENDGFDNIE